jgi:gamma-glutamyltranspeptidase / glutathione hydrolase
MRQHIRGRLLCAFMMLAPVAVAGQSGARVNSPAEDGKRVEARNGLVTSANALASEAGVEMLRAGGNAVDAAVATAFAIGVVEPQMSGLGGSGGATVWMKKAGAANYLDFYAAQSAEAWRGHTRPAGRGGRGEGAGRAGGRGSAESEDAPPATNDLGVVGVPGGVAGLLAMQDKYGALSRERVLAPAIRLARDGFPVGQILAGFIAGAESRMKRYPKAFALYFPDGKALAPGATLKNPDLAASLERVSQLGTKGFYEGETADSIVAMLNANGNPTRRSDFAAFAPQWKRPLCTDYRGYTVLSAAPPQTGYQVLHTLELLERHDLKQLGLPTQSPRAFDVFASALRAGQSVTRYNSDPNWVPVPASGLSSSDFAAIRKDKIGTGTAVPEFATDDPVTFDRSAPPPSCGRLDPYSAATPLGSGRDSTATPFDEVGERSDEKDGETTHLSVVDKDGNAVALTITNSSVWGSGAFTQGFFLNNSGFRFTDENINAPSRSQWRIRNTTIAPTIVLRNSDVQVVIGAPGGARIPTEIMQVLVYILDYSLDPLDAVRLPRIFTAAGNRQVQLEHGFTPSFLQSIRSMGYEAVAEAAGYARLYVIARRGGMWIGVADPRHDGQPRGY